MDFVTQQIARKLKDKGFKEKVHGYYHTEKEYLFRIYPERDMNYSNNKCSAPTISQVLKQLREKKKLYVYPYLLPGKNGLKWVFNIDDLNTGWIIFESCAKYSSYEEANNAGIDYVLDNLIQL